MGGFVLQTVLIVGLLSIIVLVTGRVFRLSPAVRFGLWLVVLIKLLAPPVVEWPWDARALLPEVMTQVWVAEGLSLESPLPVESALIAGATDSSLPAGAGLTAHVESGSPLTLVRLFPIAWLLGSLVVLLGHARRILRFNRALSASDPAPNRIVEITSDVAQQLQIRPPAVRVVRCLGSPIVWSFGRPLIVIPEALLSNRDAGFWRCVLAHELAHIRRRDHWFVWLEFAGSIVWWWNPLYWLVRHGLRTNVEMAADSCAVSLDPDNRRTYAESLLWVTEWGSGLNPPVPALGASSRSRKQFGARLTTILRDNHKLGVRPLGRLGILLYALLTMPAWPLGEGASEDVGETSEVAALPSQIASEVASEAVKETMEALITVWPYDISTSGRVDLPKETHLAVYPNYNGGKARGGDDRMIVVLQDPTYGRNSAGGFWPLIVHMPLSDARNLHAEMAQVISTRPLNGNEIDGMESSIYTAPYSFGDGRGRRSSTAVWKVMPRYEGVDQMRASTDVDNRLTLVLQDDGNYEWEIGYEGSFLPVIVSMDSGVALRFMADLARVIAQKS